METIAVRRVSIAVHARPLRRGTALPTVVLLVSESGDFRAAAGRVLGREGFDVVGAAHGGHALLACLEREQVDVLVVDGNLADGSSASLSGQVRRHFPEVRVVRLSETPDSHPEDLHLARPFIADELIAAVTSARDGRTATSPQAS